MENVKCNGLLQDPIYNGRKCDNPAKWFVKLNDETEYKHLRCGTHSKKKDRIPIKGNVNKPLRRRNKANENQNVDEIEIIGIKFDELMKYLESDVIKNDTPEDVLELYKVLDNINDFILNI